MFHLTCLTRRAKPTYVTTVVGIPPMEDFYLGKASERVFLPLIRKTVPEIVDMHFPAAGIFHNIVFVSIDKRYPGHARKIMSAFWGLGQLMFSKCIVVVDKDVNVQDEAEVAWIAGTHVDPSRDIVIVTGPVDDLDEAAVAPAFGGKMGIDATRKWPAEGYTGQWPTRLQTSPAASAKAEAIWKTLAGKTAEMKLSSLTMSELQDLEARAARGEAFSRADAERVMACADLVSVGVLGETARKAARGESRDVWPCLSRRPRCVAGGARRGGRSASRGRPGVG